ncbi:MAG: hypothetical protein AB7U43_07680 [Desulfobacter sp.]
MPQPAAKQSERKSTAKPANGNCEKYNSYREAFARIKQAQAEGWYFEAVTLQESILCDRLQSHLIAIGIPKISSDRSTVGNLIRKIEQAKVSTLPADLFAAISTWWQDRNIVVHAFAKSHPGEPTRSVDAALMHAKKAAKDGDRLIRNVLKWFRAQKKLHSES